MDGRGSGASTASYAVGRNGPASRHESAKKIYYMDGRLAGPIEAWRPHMARARALGFNYLCVSPIFAAGPSGDVFLTSDAETAAAYLGDTEGADGAAHALSALCRDHGLHLLIDVVLDRVASEGPITSALPVQIHSLQSMVVDPRRLEDGHGRALRLDDPSLVEAATQWWGDRLLRLVQSGVRGFRLLGVDRLPLGMLPTLIASARRGAQDCEFLAWTPGITRDRIAALSEAELDGVFASTPWWDGRASWYVEEHEALRRIAPVIGVVEPPFGERAAERGPTASRRQLKIAAATCSGLLLPIGFEFLSRRRLDPRFTTTEDLSGATSTQTPPLAAEIREANAQVDSLIGGGGSLRSLTGPGARNTLLKRGEDKIISIGAEEIRVTTKAAAPDILDKQSSAALRKAVKSSRVVVENVTPSVDGGALPAKRVVGQSVNVEADAYMDGHDVVAVELHWKPADESDWQKVPMAPLGNDRWRAAFTPNRVGRWVFTIEAYLDELATVRRALQLKKDAGVDFSVEQTEEKQLLDSGVHRAFAVRHGPLPVDVERTAATFASWYELFPRSVTDDPTRHGTFTDVIGALPRIRDMGFDVLYFPPIHPIGRTNRKGRNNTLTPGPNDPGSAYAIGSAEGGHDAIHSELGTPEDFQQLVAAAREHGLELALDFAIQCSPDHPWLKQHPDWFKHRPDGTIKYAENPPKKYEDIVNVDFYAPGAIPGLWTALRDIVLFWAGQGVRIFRVDNPHTKPLPFWQWMIADVRGRHPDVMFLSEAFTRPKMMYRLAKVGFSQSYTYFTWRNSKRELQDYLTELTATEVADYFRPNFFVNTPDINPIYLQSSGRAGFVIRAVLAATLSGLWGVYSGFEICESAPLPGREEYLDSEKYEIRVRDFNAPGNIVGEITALNRIRKAHPALQSHLNVAFYNSSNDQVMAYGKTAADHDDMIFTIVSLDPHQPQETSYEIPLWHWGLPDHASLQAENLMTGQRFTLSGKRQWLRLDPADQPFALWRLWPGEAS